MVEVQKGAEEQGSQTRKGTREVLKALQAKFLENGQDGKHGEYTDDSTTQRRFAGPEQRPFEIQEKNRIHHSY